MAHNYNSPCTQCYRCDTCSDNELENDTNKPFTYLNKTSRENYRKNWQKNKMIGMSNHDCFKSPEQHKLDLKSKRKSKEKENK